MDALGRAIVSVVDAGGGTTHQMTLRVNLQGFVLSVQGEKGRSAGTPYNDQEQQYDMLGRPMATQTPDAGDSWTLMAADDQPLTTWREGPVAIYSDYDALRRPTALRVQEGVGVTTTRTHEKLEYGEAKPTPTATYHRGRIWRTLAPRRWARARIGPTTSMTRAGNA
jgi:hypothetical protein